MISKVNQYQFHHIGGTNANSFRSEQGYFFHQLFTTIHLPVLRLP